ncbi:MAG TPA: hypothetical protein VK735_30895 [Pseudonocardia sp.]|uniref:hypothetical protein n=1 Tax=Pseudonocardia sp. TaxID=60912 RepID=UPI002BA9BF39|nr:hypothetical protein [Pseudonocardia sp.]HTF51875.1 hypothetical protein [Pseudonocardia sp.]
MIGKQLGHADGQVTGTRVLGAEGDAPRVEVSFQASGQLCDVDVTDLGTYISVVRPDGSLFGQGHGVVMTASGGRTSWTGQGAGKFLGRGAVSWRGAIYYQTDVPELAPLNGIAVIYEFQSDESGKTQATYFEWK